MQPASDRPAASAANTMHARAWYASPPGTTGYMCRMARARGYRNATCHARLQRGRQPRALSGDASLCTRSQPRDRHARPWRPSAMRVSRRRLRRQLARAPHPPSRASSPLLLAPERAPGQLGRTWRHPVRSPPAAHAPWPPSRAATVAADASPARTRGAQGAPQRGAHALVKGRKKVRGRCIYTFVNHTRNPPTLRAVALAPRQARGACTGRATARPHPDLAGRRGAAGACACAWRTAPDFVRAFVCGRTGCCGPRDSRGGRAQAPRPQPWSSSSGARSWVRASRAVRCPRLSGA